MKCPVCNQPVENTANSCSHCGHKLVIQPANKTPETGSQPISNSLVPASEFTTEKSESQSHPMSVDSHESNISTKRPGEDTNNNPKKKKRKKKKGKKKKDGRLPSNQEQINSDLSVLSLGDNQERKTQEGGDSSDSENSDNAMDVTPDCSLQDECSSLESQPRSLIADNATGPSESAPVTQSETASTTEQSTESQTAVAPDSQATGDNNNLKSAPTQTSTPATTNTPTSHSKSEDSNNTAPQAGAGKGAKVVNQKDQKTEGKSPKTKSDPPTKQTKQTKLDQNANVGPNANQTEQPKQKGKTGQQSQKPKQTAAVEQRMVFGPQSLSKAESTGSSVDPPVKTEHMEVQQSAQAAGQTSSVPQTKDATKENKNSNMESEPKMQTDPPPKKPVNRNKTIAASERLTIYFHAVLSKDFKFDPKEDVILIRAGDHIGKWDETAVELSVTRDLEEHGFLVEGSLTTTKAVAEAVSIPYKYVVYKRKKQKYEFEYIYKLDSEQHTNRCLFVKPGLLTQEGDWHQYDDIICAEPSKGMLKRIKETLWPEQRKNVVQGRDIAGKIMLDTIFDLLRSWSDTNLKSFLVQLNQFFDIYSHPSVYEDIIKKWTSLGYGEDNVRMILKEFMLENVIPQLLKEGDRKSHYVQDPMRAAVIMLYVWKQYGIKLDHQELNRLCNAFCLPKLSKDDFLQYWTDFSNTVSSLKK
uniref:Uncharacterized protein n=1 Tax=Myripristis murdjan TaxID=586833 RepID=A0A668A8U6_9TELE